MDIDKADIFSWIKDEKTEIAEFEQKAFNTMYIGMPIVLGIKKKKRLKFSIHIWLEYEKNIGS